MSLRLLRKSRAMESAPSYVAGALFRGDQRRNLSLQLLARNEPLEGPLSEAQRFTTQHLSEKSALTTSYSCGNPRTPTLGVGGFLLWKPKDTKNNRQMINSSLEWRTRNGIGCLFLINCKIQDEQIQIRDTEFR